MRWECRSKSAPRFRAGAFLLENVSEQKPVYPF
nr:MAG TPA: hypothetical protein [Caudoviricetes sp.]